MKKRSHRNYPSILVNKGTHPTVLCWFLCTPPTPQSMPHSAAVNFSFPKFLCRCIINFLSSCGKFETQRKHHHHLQSLDLPQKSPKLFLPKIDPGFSFSVLEKKEQTFPSWILASPFPSILLGEKKGGSSCFFFRLIY